MDPFCRAPAKVACIGETLQPRHGVDVASGAWVCRSCSCSVVVLVHRSADGDAGSIRRGSSTCGPAAASTAIRNCDTARSFCRASAGAARRPPALLCTPIYCQSSHHQSRPLRPGATASCACCSMFVARGRGPPKGYLGTAPEPMCLVWAAPAARASWHAPAGPPGSAAKRMTRAAADWRLCRLPRLTSASRMAHGHHGTGPSRTAAARRGVLARSTASCACLDNR